MKTGGVFNYLFSLSFFFLLRFPWKKGASKAFSQIRKGVGYFQVGCCYSHGTTRYIYHHKSYKKKLQFFGWKSPPTISIFFQCLEHVLNYLLLYACLMGQHNLQFTSNHQNTSCRWVETHSFCKFHFIFENISSLQYVPTLFDWYKSLFGYFFYPLCICTHSTNQGDQ